MRKSFFLLLLTMFLFPAAMMAKTETPAPEGKITVTGTSTVSITPDRITVEIGMLEYYNKLSDTDSVKVTLQEIEQVVREVLEAASVADSLITVVDVGTSYYYYPVNRDNLLLTKRISAVLTGMEQLEKLAESMDIKGVNSFRISGTDASNMDIHNRRGLTAALDKARQKAELIASNEGLRLVMPVEIVEDGPMYYDEEAVVTNVALDSAVGAVSAKYAARSLTMDNMKKIVRRYSVRVTYLTNNN